MIQPRPVEYPESDGLPMAETEEHAEAMLDLFQTIRNWLADPARWHVFGNQFFYYVRGNAQKAFSPDVYVIRGVPQLPRRRIWKLWEEPAAVPALVIELTSESSVTHDLGFKRELYEQLGVEEYVVFDVLRETGRSPIRIWRREGTRFEEQSDLRSAVLGVGFKVEDWRLRLVAPDGTLVPSDKELSLHHARRADTEAQARREAEEELARLRAELEKLRR